jgi:hypothetical protein
MLRRAAFALLLITTSGIPVLAADSAVQKVSVPPAAAVESSASAAATAPAELSYNPHWTPSFGNSPSQASTARPALLPMLYIGLASFNMYDAYSTTRGLSLGARESNALMRGIAGQPAAIWAVKGAATALPIFIAERMWRTHRTRAIVTMALTNALMGAVAVHNMHVLQQQQRN